MAEAPSLPRPRSLLSRPAGLATHERRLWVADTGHDRILELSLHENGARAHGRIERVWGDAPGFRDGGSAAALFRAPTGLCIDGARLLVVDSGNHAIRSVDVQSGDVTTVAGIGTSAADAVRSGPATRTPLANPGGVAAIGELVLVSMMGSHQIWLVAEDALGRFAGAGEAGTRDGAPGDASFNQPSGLAVGEGDLWVADTGGNSIRRIALTGSPEVITVAGATDGEDGDRDGVGHAARLRGPRDVAVAGGRVMIADTGNHRIRLLDPSSAQMIAIAGSGARGRSDGLLMQIELDSPSAVTMNGTTLYIADTGNNRIVRADLTTLDAATLFVSAPAETGEIVH